MKFQKGLPSCTAEREHITSLACTAVPLFCLLLHPPILNFPAVLHVIMPARILIVHRIPVGICIPIQAPGIHESSEVCIFCCKGAGVGIVVTSSQVDIAGTRIVGFSVIGRFNGRIIMKLLILFLSPPESCSPVLPGNVFYPIDLTCQISKIKYMPFCPIMPHFDILSYI